MMLLRLELGQPGSQETGRVKEECKFREGQEKDNSWPVFVFIRQPLDVWRVISMQEYLTEPS